MSTYCVVNEYAALARPVIRRLPRAEVIDLEMPSLCQPERACEASERPQSHFALAPMREEPMHAIRRQTGDNSGLLPRRSVTSLVTTTSNTKIFYTRPETSYPSGDGP
ncbi:hypothetical protein TRVL_06235 [Trypanosoma vivax]|uniref:Uncharacterized protein n=1 Tax=Trypanosoma vivax (strain Y486) TaxID=1055687 RepID=G0U1D0_TRYVY|nr:hypothetical protein TRVL_06235 [Trypanosoma vivax]CCC49885.1 conserved hypothetical protein [Trypanosoma vivax Y486]